MGIFRKRKRPRDELMKDMEKSADRVVDALEKSGISFHELLKSLPLLLAVNTPKGERNLIEDTCEHIKSAAVILYKKKEEK